MSTDDTVNKTEKFINGDERFTIIKNKTKMYQPGNYDQIIRGDYDLQDEDICVEVDGDDWLSDENVLDRIYNLYLNNDVWLANGSFKYHDGRMGFASPHNNFDDIRQKPFTLSHIRTWKTFLWRNIKEEDLKDNNGVYWSVAGDLSFMYPMAEMSGIEHYRFMNEVNYIYNESNPLNDHKVNLPKVYETVNKIRNMKPYKKLFKNDLL
jgi:hypothetical protein